MEVLVGGKKGIYRVPEKKFDAFLDLVHTQDSFRGRWEDAEAEDFRLRGVGEPVVLDLVGIVPFVKAFRIPVDPEGNPENREFIDVIMTLPMDKVEKDNVILVGRGVYDSVPARAEAGELIYFEDLRAKSPDEVFIGEGISDGELVEFVNNVKEALEDVRETHPSLVEKLEKVTSFDNPDPEAVRVAVEEYLKEINETTPKGTLRLLYSDLKALGLKDLEVGDTTLPKKKSVADVLREYINGEENEFTVNVAEAPLNAVAVGVNISPVGEEKILLHFFPERFNLRSSRSIAKDLSASYDYRLLNYLLSMVRNPTVVVENEKIRDIVIGKLRKKVAEMNTRESAGVYTPPLIKEIYERAWDALEARDKERFVSVLEEAKDFLIDRLRENLAKNNILSAGSILVRKKNGEGFFMRDQLSNIGNSLDFWNRVSYDLLVEGKDTYLALMPVPRIVNEDGQLLVKKVYKPFAYTTGENLEEWHFNRADAYHMAFDYPLYRILKGIERAQSWEEVRRLFSEGSPQVMGLETFEEKVSSFKNVAPVYQDVIAHIRGVFRSVIYTPDDGDILPEEKLAQAKALLKDDPFLSEFMETMTDFLITRHRLKNGEFEMPGVIISRDDPIFKTAENIVDRISEAVAWSWDVQRARKSLGLTPGREEVAQEETTVAVAPTEVAEPEQEVENILDELDKESEQIRETLGFIDEGFDMDWDDVSHQFDRVRLKKGRGGEAPAV